MSDIAEIIKEKEKIDFPIILVTSIKRNKGRETTTKRLDDAYYKLRAQINKSSKHIFNYLELPELSEKIQEFESRGINHHIRYYVAPIKRRKKEENK